MGYRKRPCRVHGVCYDSLKAAANALGSTFDEVKKAYYSRKPGYESVDGKPKAAAVRKRHKKKQQARPPAPAAPKAEVLFPFDPANPRKRIELQARSTLERRWAGWRECLACLKYFFSFDLSKNKLCRTCGNYNSNRVADHYLKATL